jgi:ABC-type uncharacterized transport system, permease component
MMVIGVVAGIINACLSLYLKIPPLLSGIIMMAALFAIAIILVKLNNGQVNLDASTFTVFSWFSDLLLSWGLSKVWVNFLSPIVITAIFLGLSMGGIYFFFGTEMGLALRASGKNKQMAKANGINVKLMTIIGLAISSLLVALSATLYAQKNLTGSPQDGQGMIVLGLSTLFLGEAIIPHASFKMHLWATLGGSFVYWYIIQILFQFVPKSDTFLYLYKALLLVLVLAIPYLLQRYKKKRARRLVDEKEAKEHVRSEERHLPLSLQSPLVGFSVGHSVFAPTLQEKESPSSRRRKGGQRTWCWAKQAVFAWRHYSRSQPLSEYKELAQSLRRDQGCFPRP